MPPIVLGAVIGGGLAAGGTIAGSLINSSAQDDAANAAAAGQREALASNEKLVREGMDFQKQQAALAASALKEQNDQAQGILKPYQDIQLQAAKESQALTNPDSPIYQQQRQRMTQAIQQQLAAQGLLRSKNQSDLLTNLELGLEQQRTERIGGLANLGAAQGLAGLSQNYGGGLAGIYGGLGQNIGSQFSGLGANAANTGSSLAQLRAQQIQAGAANTAGLISGLTNIGGNVLGGIQKSGQQEIQNAILAKYLGIDLKSLTGGT